MEDATFISLLNGQKDDLRLIIEENGVAVRGVIRSEIDRIDEMDEKRNERIGKLEDKTTVLEQSDSNRTAIKNALGKSFVIGCAILGAALTVVKLIGMVGS